jgi:Ca2+-binding RTX toxin-like protein
MILATALTTMFALMTPLAGGAQAAEGEFHLNVVGTDTVQIGTVHPLEATIIDGVCTESDGCQVDFEIESGPSDLDNTPLTPDAGCTVTQGTSICGTSVTSTDTGRQIIRAWVDDDNDNSTYATDADTTEKANPRTSPGERPEPDDTDVLAVTWANTGEPNRVEALPASANIRYGQIRTISCQVFDGFDHPVSSANCDAQVDSGPNANNVIGNGTTLGYIGECTTGPDGEECTISYTSQEVGTDNVNVFADYSPSNNVDGTGNNPEPSAFVASIWTSDIKSGPCADLNYNSSRARPGGGRIIAGSPQANTLNGGPGPDTICALGGNDKVDGNGGNDHVLAGLGWDNVVGEGGDDNLDGNEGRDTLNGGDGVDSIVAGGHNDIMVGGGGNDIMKGQDGTDALRGKGGADTMEGGTDADIMFGHSGNDTLKGGGGNDELDGGLGKDTCVPGPGRDQVRRCE